MKMLKNYKNVFVDDCNRNVHDLILISEPLFTMTTTTIEAYTLKKYYFISSHR